jgi:D-alanyl-D-alanine carboxypeptidase
VPQKCMDVCEEMSDIVRPMHNQTTRRTFLGQSASALGAALLPVGGSDSAPVVPRTGLSDLPSLDVFAAQYMRVMHAPGMTVGWVSNERRASRAFGFANLESKSIVEVSQPFWIGSICKSFVGIVAMQLRDEGKLDVHEPVLEIMPDLPFRNDFGAITAHHLLTHTSGLPNWLQLISSDPAQIAVQAYKPGERFAYCNLAYDTLGLLIAFLDGRSWPEAVTARILQPLGMIGASAQIDDSVQARMPTGYHYQYGSAASVVGDPLVPVGYVRLTDAAGCITATADDMSRYACMLANRGKFGDQRIVSEEGFRLFSTPYIKAPVLSSSSSYGYGIGVDTVDGRTVLRHTGGTTAFASSILVDLDSGLGAFASINAMQGYRPNAVTQYVVEMLYAQHEQRPEPAAPAIPDPLACSRQDDYVGTYTSSVGDVLAVRSRQGILSVESKYGRSPLRVAGTDAFSAARGAVLDNTKDPAAPSEFVLIFEREDKPGTSSKVITSVSYGSRWYARPDFHGTIHSPKAPQAERYVGTYSNDSPWFSQMKVVERRGKLWLDGEAEMHLVGRDRFSIEGEEGTMELEFFAFLQGRAQAMKCLGESIRRVNLS